MCNGHEGRGPWGPPQIVAPLDGNEVVAELSAAMASLADLPRVDDAADVAEIFSCPLPARADGRSWELEMRAAVAAAALEGLARELGGVRFEVMFDTSGTPERQELVLRRRFPAADPRIVRNRDNRMLLRTSDPEDVRFLVGFHVTQALSPFAIVIVRAAGFAGGLLFDWDKERFYIADETGVILRHVLWAAVQNDLEVVGDTGGISIMGGTPERVAAVQAWIRAGAPDDLSAF